jgi:iron complex outermembrane receptor protein
VVWEQYLKNRFRLTVTGFNYPLRDLISAADAGGGVIQYRNAGAVDLRGADVTIRRRSAWGLEGGVNYSFQKSTNRDHAVPSINSPAHLGRAFLSAPLIRHALFASFDLQYVSSRRTLAGQRVAAYAVSNLTILSRSLGNNWDVSASIYNILDRRYGDPGAIEHRQDILQQDGRQFRVKAGYTF